MKKRYCFSILIILFTFVSCIPDAGFFNRNICSTTNNDAEIIADGIAYIEQVFYDKVKYRNTGIKDINTKDNSDKKEIKYYSDLLEKEITVTFISAYMNASYEDEKFEYTFWEKTTDYLEKFLETQEEECNKSLGKTLSDFAAENFSSYKIFYDLQETACITHVKNEYISEKEKCIKDERQFWPKFVVHLAVYDEASPEKLTASFVDKLNSLLDKRENSLPDVKIYYMLSQEIFNKFKSEHIHKDTESLTSERYECKCSDEGKIGYIKF